MVTCAGVSVLWHKAEHLPLSTAEVKSIGLKDKRNYYEDIVSGRNTVMEAGQL